MKTRINLYASLLSLAILTGCSSAPVYDNDTTEIDNAAVKTAQVGSADVEIVPVISDLVTVFYFDFDKALLNAESRGALLEHAAILKGNSRAVRLEGHADERGTREYNIALGERRAAAAKEFLVLQGVAGDRIEVISFGEERAAAFGSDDEAWRLNRRVELK
jgi:peptidoglycan-associated lipoprotein